MSSARNSLPICLVICSKSDASVAWATSIRFSLVHIMAVRVERPFLSSFLRRPPNELLGIVAQLPSCWSLKHFWAFGAKTLKKNSHFPGCVVAPLIFHAHTLRTSRRRKKSKMACAPQYILWRWCEKFFRLFRVICGPISVVVSALRLTLGSSTSLPRTLRGLRAFPIQRLFWRQNLFSVQFCSARRSFARCSTKAQLLGW